MDALSRLLSSRVKAGIFRLLFGLDACELHVREIARRAELNDATVRQELRLVSELHLVEGRRDGNRTYYRANTGHPLYPEIRSLVLKTSGLADMLRKALEGGQIEIAFVFGSLAAGAAKSGSDVDLMVVGTVSLRQIVRRLSGVANLLGREINPHVLTEQEFARRRKAKDHFLTTVMGSPKLFVIGNEHELEGMGG